MVPAKTSAHFLKIREGNYEGALLAYQAAARQNPHMEQIETIITSLKKRLRGEAL